MTPNNNGQQSVRERRFRDLEHVFSAYMRIWPGALRVKAPDGIEATTFSNRIRKVAGEFLHDRWSTTFEPGLFGEMWEKTVVGVTDDGQVQIRYRGKGQVQAQAGVQLAGQAGQTTDRAIEDREMFWRLIELHRANIFKEATHIRELAPELASELEKVMLKPAHEREVKNVEFWRHPTEAGWLLL